MNRKKQILSDQYLAGDYGLGSWLGSNVGNIAQTIGGAALIATGVGVPAGIGMMASGVGGFASDAVSSKLAKEEEEINTKNNNAMIGKSRLDSYSKPQMIPTFATGGHLPEGKATLKDAKEYIKLFPDEMKMGEEVEYEHTGNKKLAQRIAADHIKDHLRMTGGDPGYYTRLKEAGISDELNKMGYGGKLTSDKAKEILKDGSIRGKKLTDRQKRYFGFIAGGGTPKKQDGGEIDLKKSNAYKFADKPAAEYRQAVVDVDSLRTNFLTPALLKKAGVSSVDQVPLDFYLTNEEFNQNLDPAGRDLWKKQLGVLGSWNDVTGKGVGKNESNVTDPSQILYGKRMAGMNWINAGFDLRENNKYIGTRKAFEPGMNIPKSVSSYGYGGVMKDVYSMSGSLTDSTSFNEVNPITEYKGGGTHEQNPYGGIPLGNKARVESGEIRVDFPNEGSYIFSNKF